MDTPPERRGDHWSSGSKMRPLPMLFGGSIMGTFRTTNGRTPNLAKHLCCEKNRVLKRIALRTTVAFDTPPA